jgi:type I restriction enzyme S subunit
MNITKADTLPESWIKTTLGNISILRGQYGLGASSVDFQTGKPRYIRITDIDNNGELNNEIKSPAGNAEEWKDYFLDEGDLLFARSGATVGKTYLHKKSDEAFVFAGYLIRFKINQEIADPLFIFYFSKTSFYSNWVSSIQTVAAQPNVNASSYGSLKIPLPPLAEQKQIVAILQEADALRRKKKEILEKSNRLAGALFLEMFGDPVRNEKGWDILPLGKMLNQEPQNGLYKHSSEYGDGTKILRIDSFYDGKVINLENLKKLKLSEMEIEKYKVFANDILINRVNSIEYLGKCALVPSINEDIVFESNIMRFSIDLEKINPLFLIKNLLHQSCRNQLLKLAKVAINQASINQQDVKSIKIPLPPLHLQNDFAQKVQAIEDTTKQIESSLQKMEKLYDSLLQKAFTGNLWFDKLTMTKVS